MNGLWKSVVGVVVASVAFGGAAQAGGPRRAGRAPRGAARRHIARAHERPNGALAGPRRRTARLNGSAGDAPKTPGAGRRPRRFAETLPDDLYRGARARLFDSPGDDTFRAGPRRSIRRAGKSITTQSVWDDCDIVH